MFGEEPDEAYWESPASRIEKSNFVELRCLNFIRALQMADKQEAGKAKPQQVSSRVEARRRYRDRALGSGGDSGESGVAWRHRYRIVGLDDISVEENVSEDDGAGKYKP